MATQARPRQDRRREAREQRHAREAAERAARERGRRARRLLWVALAAAATVAVMIVVQETTLPQRDVRPASAQAERVFQGIPQDGFSLGNPDAPVTVVEFVDMQCRFCAQFATQQLPPLVERYVRSGQARLELRTLAFLGPDSVRGAQAVAAAAQQDRAWDFAHAFFARQGAENSGYATDEFVREVAKAAGVDGDRAVEGADEAGIDRAKLEAAAAGLDSTPTFLVNGTKATMQDVQAKIEAALR